MLRSSHLKRQAVTVSAGTRLSGSQVLGVCEQVSTVADPRPAGGRGAAEWRTLGLYQCLRLVLLALRHNLPQELLARPARKVCQPTVWRVISAYAPLVAGALETSATRC